MTDAFYLASASDKQKSSSSNPPVPWTLHLIDVPARPLTRPPAVLLSLWDVRRARLTSPSYYRHIPPPVSPFPEPQRSFATIATQTTDSEWESPAKPTEYRRPSTPPCSPERRYTPPPRTVTDPSRRLTSSLTPPSSPESRYTPPPRTVTDPPSRLTSTLTPPSHCIVTKTAPCITWQPCK
ncbi:proline-rich receptor-like protein kinase PERK8 [Neodiprion fabricii]|uniref:proline-rich receptor-like protein kinase PERK8 n=1 Tax=Neodiprion fabricii TaxID=2872261 RepID=UPI001ED8C3D5|nr:proline-rich receptor-like protein kinase PERK8 [Neodiprion fabricii]